MTWRPALAALRFMLFVAEVARTRHCLVSQSVRQTSSQSATVSQAVKQAISQAVEQAISQSVNQLISHRLGLYNMSNAFVTQTRVAVVASP